MSSTKCFKIMLTIISFLMLTTISFAASDVSRSDSYLKQLKTNSIHGKISTARSIIKSGLSNASLFNYIESEVLNNYQHTGKDRLKTDLMAWYCKALASSGNSKYKATVEKVLANTTNRNLIRHAQKSLDMYDYYAKRNKDMKNPPKNKGKYDAQTNRLLDLLNSGNARLQTNAAKEISRHGNSNPVVFATIAKALRNSYKAENIDKNTLDMLAWYCKALAASGNVKYQAVLQEVMDGSSSTKLKKYARQSYDRL